MFTYYSTKIAENMTYTYEESTSRNLVIFVAAFGWYTDINKRTLQQYPFATYSTEYSYGSASGSDDYVSFQSFLRSSLFDGSVLQMIERGTEENTNLEHFRTYTIDVNVTRIESFNGSPTITRFTSIAGTTTSISVNYDTEIEEDVTTTKYYINDYTTSSSIYFDIWYYATTHEYTYTDEFYQTTTETLVKNIRIVSTVINGEITTTRESYSYYQLTSTIMHEGPLISTTKISRSEQASLMAPVAWENQLAESFSIIENDYSDIFYIFTKTDITDGTFHLSEIAEAKTKHTFTYNKILSILPKINIISSVITLTLTTTFTIFPYPTITYNTFDTTSFSSTTQIFRSTGTSTSNTTFQLTTLGILEKTLISEISTLVRTRSIFNFDGFPDGTTRISTAWLLSHRTFSFSMFIVSPSFELIPTECISTYLEVSSTTYHHLDRDDRLFVYDFTTNGFLTPYVSYYRDAGLTTLIDEKTYFSYKKYLNGENDFLKISAFKYLGNVFSLNTNIRYESVDNSTINSLNTVLLQEDFRGQKMLLSINSEDLKNVISWSTIDLHEDYFGTKSFLGGHVKDVENIPTYIIKNYPFQILRRDSTNSEQTTMYNPNYLITDFDKSLIQIQEITTFGKYETSSMVLVYNIFYISADEYITSTLSID